MQNSTSVPNDHPCLAGHFPDQPIIPAVVLLDLMQEQLTIFCRSEHISLRKITGIKKLKFTGLVKSEQIISFSFSVKSDEKIQASVSCNNLVVASGSVLTQTVS